MRSLVVTVTPDQAELAADRLWQLGVRAIEERDGAGGDVELWTAVGDDDGSIASAISTLDRTWGWRTEEPGGRWPETWREHAGPMPCGDRLLVVPAWQEADAPASPGGRRTVLIEPGAAFGLGDHPTTALSLAALDRELRRRPGSSVLDAGCGSGVLAIAAARLDAAPVRAVDIAVAAVEATIANAARNDVAGPIEADTTPIPELDGAWDVVVANILAPVLVALARDLRRLTAPAGRLVVSGILADSHDHVLDALAPMEVDRVDTSDGWAAVTLRHPD